MLFKSSLLCTIQFCFPFLWLLPVPTFPCLSLSIAALVRCPQPVSAQGGNGRGRHSCQAQHLRLQSSREEGPSSPLPYCSHLRNLPGRNSLCKPPEKKPKQSKKPRNKKLMPSHNRHERRRKAAVCRGGRNSYFCLQPCKPPQTILQGN